MFHLDQIDLNDPNHPPELLELAAEAHEIQRKLLQTEKHRLIVDASLLCMAAFAFGATMSVLF